MRAASYLLLQSAAVHMPQQATVVALFLRADASSARHWNDTPCSSHAHAISRPQVSGFAYMCDQSKSPALQPRLYHALQKESAYMVKLTRSRESSNSKER